MITVIAILVAILLPAVQRVRASSRSTQSKNNLAQMGKAMKHYEGTDRGNLSTDDWEQKLSPFVDDASIIFADPADEDGSPSYALSSKVVRMGANDDKKIVIVESDARVIDLDVENCTGSTPTISGVPVARHLGMTNALLYGGAVRSFEPADIDLADATKEPLVIWWLPYNEHGNVCGTVVTVDNPDPLPSPSGTEPETEIVPEEETGPTCTPADYSGYYVVTKRGIVHYLQIAPYCRDAETDPPTVLGTLLDDEYWETESGYSREGPDSFIWIFDDLGKLDWNDMVLMFDPQPDCSMKISFIAGDYVQWGVHLDLFDPDGVLIDDFWEPGDVYVVPPQQ